MGSSAYNQRRFAGNRDGNVAIFAGMLFVPLLGLAGGGVDLVRYSLYTAELQAANDAAILAASKLVGADEDEQRDVAFEYLDANLSTDVSSLRITFQEFRGPDNCTASNPAAGAGPTSCLEVDAEMDTFFIKLFNIPTLNISASSQATINLQPMEIAFGFDTTGSMKFGSRWDDATDALSNMLDVLQTAAESSGGDGFRVSLVPFSDRITLPSDLEAAVLDPAIPLVTSGTWRYKGCVEPREETLGGDPYTLTDDAPSTLRFRPSQDGQFGQIYGNYPIDPQPAKLPICPNIEIIPVTDDVQDVQDGLDALEAKGTGRFDVGAAWVWRTLSPKWRGVLGDSDWPRDYLDDDGNENIKVAVIITDGNTVGYEYEVWDSPEPHQPFGYNKGTPKGFEHFVDVCEAMADEGIHVHMVHVGGSPSATYYNEDFVDYAQDCASRADYYHPVDDVDDLIAAFQTIGDLTSQLRLTG